MTERPLLVVLAAMFGWGLDNNLTRRISGKDPVAIAMIKGPVSGAASLALAFGLGRGFEAGAAVLIAREKHVHEHAHPEMDHVHGRRPDGEHRHGH